MKFHTPLYALLVFSLTILGVLWFFPGLERQEAMPIFAATVHRDCAPGNGTAFTVSIPVAKIVIGISIYENPDLRLPVKFSFPDNTEQPGNALLFSPTTLPEPLTGKVSFQPVKEGSPVLGEFNLRTETGERFKGRFRAEWNNPLLYCG